MIDTRTAEQKALYPWHPVVVSGFADSGDAQRVCAMAGLSMNVGEIAQRMALDSIREGRKDRVKIVETV